ncbi:MAG: hypothetical protein AAGD06_31585 [Acidobacteriota bacterium]
MNRRAAALCLALALTSALPSAAEKGSTNELIALTGLAQELALDIEENRRYLLALCAASPKCLPFGEELATAVKEASQDLRLGPMVRPMVDEMLDVMPEEYHQDLFAFLRSPLGLRVVELERLGRSPENRALLAAEGAEIYSRLTDDRIFLFEDLDSRGDGAAGLRGLDRFALRIVEWLERRADARGLSAATSQAQDAPDRGSHIYYQWLAITYEPMADEELRRYTEFLASQAGEHWSKTRNEIRRHAVREASEPILDRLVEAIDED